MPLEVDKMFDTENVLKLLVLLYVDDTLILADSPEKLQKSLHNLSLYWEKLHLTVNENNIKIMIFSKRKFKHRSIFYYANKNVEIVRHIYIVQNFKYLDIVFSFNGKTIECIKDITTRAQRVMFSILKRSRDIYMPIDIQVPLFDSMVTPILLYGCEAWRNENNYMIEKLYIRFCKYVLHLKTSTPTCMVPGELRRGLMILERRIRMLRYCNKLLDPFISK